MKLNLSFKIIVIVFFIALILTVFSSFLTISRYNRNSEKLYLEKAYAIANTISVNDINSEIALHNHKAVLTALNKQIWLTPDIIDISIILPENNSFDIHLSTVPQKNSKKADEISIEAYESNKITHKFIDTEKPRKLRIATPITFSNHVWGVYQFDMTLEVLDQSEKETNDNILFSGIGTVVLFTFFLFLILNFVVIKPIEKLSVGVTHIAKGEFDYRVNHSSEDEIGMLSNSFNKMAQELKQTHVAIIHHEEELKKTVDSRTKELNKEVEELENTKKAVLNILEDTDETNKDLSKTKEQLNEKVAQMEDINKKKDEFISITAHELKTPLTSIKGFAELLLNPKIAQNKKQSAQYFNIIIEDTKRLSDLITDMLDCTRLDLGTMRFYYEKTTAEELTTELKNLTEVAVKQKGLKMIINIDKRTPLFYTDKFRVSQVLANLVNNSIKYTEKGSITIEVFKEKEFIHFRNIDTGVGIPKEAQPKIFQRFFQADSSYTRKVGGTGLGLSICKGIAEALGGKIWFKSRPGKTEFEFTLKYLKKAPDVPEERKNVLKEPGK